MSHMYPSGGERRQKLGQSSCGKQCPSHLFPGIIRLFLHLIKHAPSFSLLISYQPPSVSGCAGHWYVSQGTHGLKTRLSPASREWTLLSNTRTSQSEAGAQCANQGHGLRRHLAPTKTAHKRRPLGLLLEDAERRGLGDGC